VSSEASTFLILADESAAWQVAGLPQLDRLVLALNEFADSLGPDTKFDVGIFWRPDISTTKRWLPRHRRINRIRLTESVSSIQSESNLIDTRLFVRRHGLAQLLQSASLPKVASSIVATPDSWTQLVQKFKQSLRPKLAGKESPWQYLETPADIRACERKILRQSGKSQDGLISRFVNRPISRAVTRLLLKYEVEPTSWTVAMLVLPLAAFFLLVRGDYAGILLGAAIFQLYSIVDGCDGEIARAKYLESEGGARIDDLCDMFGSILFVIGLGLGLFRSRASAYALEGIVCAAVILTNEWFLRRERFEINTDAPELRRTLYPRHQRLFAQSNGLMFGEKFWWWIIQFTKRDVAIFVFLVLAIIDRPQWILHLWLAVSSVTLILSAKTHVKRRDVADSSS
jgi:hypothetical protein